VAEGNPMQDGMKYKHKTICESHTPATRQGSQLNQDERKYGRLTGKGRREVFVENRTWLTS